MLSFIVERTLRAQTQADPRRDQPSRSSKIVAVPASLLAALASAASYFLFLCARHAGERPDESLEVTGSCIALAVALLIWLRVQHDKSCPHLLWVAAALVGTGLVDGIHGIAPFGAAWSCLRRGGPKVPAWGRKS